MEFFFDGHLRLDWGLGNPNKTASLIGCLMVLLHSLWLLKSRKVAWSLFVIGFLSLGICLVHTYSRGGIVAAAGGQMAAFFYLLRGSEMLRKRRIASGVAILTFILGIYSILPGIDAGSRYIQGIAPSSDEDRSITNRLRVWRDAPRMMVDAPGGWGNDQAGEGWMQWYQPLETRYRYRTLVNGHLTELVELGWVGRFFYLFLWSLLLVVPALYRGESRRDSVVNSVMGGTWIAFGISCCFSSVNESWQLWIPPLLALAAALIFVWIPTRQRVLCVWKLCSFSAAVLSLVLLGTIWAVGKSHQKSADTAIRVKNGTVYVGAERQPDFVIIEPDKEVLGLHYGHSIREGLRRSWAIVPKWAHYSAASGNRIVLSGMVHSESMKTEPIAILNPKNLFENWDGQNRATQIFVGDLRKDPVARAFRSKALAEEVFSNKFTLVLGKKLYLSNWVKLLQSLPSQPNL